MTMLTALASSNGVGYAPPEQDLAAAVVVVALDDLRRRELRQDTASEIRAGGLEPWLLLLDAFPTVGERVRAEVHATMPQEEEDQ